MHVVSVSRKCASAGPRLMALFVARRRGVTSVLAMLYLMLFAALAIGFYATTTSSTTIVSNDRRISQAQAAAESGMDFLRFQLFNVDIPAQPTPTQAWHELTTQLRAALEGTGNLGGMSIHIDSDEMRIPANPDDFIALDAEGGLFRAQIDNLGQKVRVKVTGKF